MSADRTAQELARNPRRLGGALEELDRQARAIGAREVLAGLLERACELDPAVTAPIQEYRLDDSFVEITEEGDDYRGIYMARVGKKAAGRELDGRTWDEMPEVPA